MKKLLLILLCLPMIGFGQALDLTSETSIRKYLDTETLDPLEGIYQYNIINTSRSHKIAIIKEGYKFNGTIIESVGYRTKPGQIRMTLEESAIEGVYSMLYIDKWGSKQNVTAFVKAGLIEFTYYGNDKEIMYLTYPKKQISKKKKVKNGEWAGNGSGIIISKSGYIITNHHVIDDADDIEVEFILDDEVQKFNAEIVQSDKVNDLAIIKIVDVNFDGVKELPYNFKTRSSDVGTKVYAFGYPMALTIMGKEIKVTDGIISSKTGFDGDITTYQISAPIQGGNSGGPLFDDKGNFIGINSSGINKKLVDNVGYSIKTSYVLNLIDILPKSIDLPSNKKLTSLPLTEQIKEISKYVVLVKVK